MDHDEAVLHAALHVMLVVAMHRLGLTSMEVREDEYLQAIEGFSDLRVQSDGTFYRATRL